MRSVDGRTRRSHTILVMRCQPAIAVCLLILAAAAGSPIVCADEAAPEPSAQPSAESQSSDGSKEDRTARERIERAARTLLRYHEDPDPDAIDAAARTLIPSPLLDDWMNAAFVMGFLTAAFREHPDRVEGWFDGWIPEVFEKDRYKILVFALSMADHPDADPIYQRMLETADRITHAIIVNYIDRDVDDPLSLRPAEPYHLPVLWGYYCCTGDEAALDRILEFTMLERDDTLPLDAATVLSFAVGESDAVRTWAERRREAFETGADDAHPGAGELGSIIEDAAFVHASSDSLGLTILGVPAAN